MGTTTVFLYVFIAYHSVSRRGERRHSALQVEIDGRLGPDGYVIDFSVLKKAVRSACKALDERTLIPLHCDGILVQRLPAPPQLQGAVQVSHTPLRQAAEPAPPPASTASTAAGVPHIALTLADGSVFVLPEADCRLLPLSNVSVEELSVYLAEQVAAQLPLQQLLARGVKCIKVGVQETPNQKATFIVGLQALADSRAQAGAAEPQ